MPDFDLCDLVCEMDTWIDLLRDAGEYERAAAVILAQHEIMEDVVLALKVAEES